MATLAEMLTLTSSSYRLADFWVKSDESNIAKFMREMFKAGRLRTNNGLRTGGTFFDQTFPTSAVLTDFDTSIAHQRISAPSEWSIAIGGLAQGYEVSETEYQLMVQLAEAMPSNPKPDDKVVNYINRTLQNKIFDKMDNQAMRQLYIDLEYSFIVSTMADGTATPIKGLTSIVNSSGPSASYGGVDLTGLNVKIGKPWYVTGSTGTGANGFGNTLTGDGSIGKADFIKWHTAICNDSQYRGVNMKWTIVNNADYNEWQAYNTALRGTNEVINIGDKSLGKNLNPVKDVSSQLVYDMNTKRVIGLNDTIFIPTLACPAGSAWIVDPNCLKIERVVPKYEYKNMMKYNSSHQGWFEYEIDKIYTSRAGKGKGALIDIGTFLQLVPINTAGVAYIGYTAANS